ncbi:hypothetical protein V6N13_082337 [Hibiscus sabdariffa]
MAQDARGRANIDVEDEEVIVEEMNEKQEEEDEDTDEEIVNTSEEEANPLAMVVYTGPLKALLPTSDAADDARVELETKEKFEGYAKPK